MKIKHTIDIRRSIIYIMLFFCSKRGCFFQPTRSRHDSGFYTKLYEIRRRMFSMMIILSQFSYWDWKNMSEGGHKALVTTCGVSNATHHSHSSFPCLLVPDHLTHSKLVPGNRTNYQSQSRSPDSGQCSVYYLPMKPRPRLKLPV